MDLNADLFAHYSLLRKARPQEKAVQAGRGSTTLGHGQIDVRSQIPTPGSNRSKSSDPG